jgi:hypothetical protein
MYSLSTVTNHRRSLSGFIQPGKCMFIAIAVRFNNTAGLTGTQRAGSLLYGYLHASEPCRFDTVEIYFPLRIYSSGSQTVGRPPPCRGAVGPLEGRAICMSDILILNKTLTQDKIIF